MAGYKNTTEENVLDFVLANESPTGDGVFYLGLYNSDPTDSTTGSEVTGGSYVRQPITLSRTNQTLSNTNTITFPEATANWGTVVAFALSTAASGGTQIMYGSLSPSKTVVTGETLTIAIGQFTQTID
jgi:hypothetical protein